MTVHDPDCLVFVSHIHEDGPVAAWLKQRIENDFRGDIEVFVSTEAPLGTEWLGSIEDHLEKTELLIALCSPAAVKRPWVHFEVGAAWALKRTVIPACHAGQAVGELEDPFRRLQGMTLTDPDGLRRLYAVLCEKVGATPDGWDFATFATQVPTPLEVAGPPDEAAAQTADPEGDIKHRLHLALTEAQPWRTIEWLTIGAGVQDEEIVLTILRADPDVRFSRSKSGKLMAGLKSRVGP